ncbi:hypothetical protein [Candidatus Albibeggiatoa sp. nov. BB20]|uniref:hypothetical protein n=1 Tax=Candidatus Albibeggiatoa sp. nov. BB20 TaxID=3162723 RepID=UPI00336545AB
MNQQEIIHLIKATPIEHIKISQLNNGVIDIQILPLKQKEAAIGLDALMIFQQNNFIGCLHEEHDLSVNYKQALDWSDKL